MLDLGVGPIDYYSGERNWAETRSASHTISLPWKNVVPADAAVSYYLDCVSARHALLTLDPDLGAVFEALGRFAPSAIIRISKPVDKVADCVNLGEETIEASRTTQTTTNIAAEVPLIKPGYGGEWPPEWWGVVE